MIAGWPECNLQPFGNPATEGLVSSTSFIEEGEFRLKTWQKFFLILVVGLMLIAPFGTAYMTAQPAAQLTVSVQTKHAAAGGAELYSWTGFSWPVGGCGSVGLVCPQVNWNS